MERDQAVKFMQDLLRAMVAKKGSDLFITTGFAPAISVRNRVAGRSMNHLDEWRAA